MVYIAMCMTDVPDSTGMTQQVYEQIARILTVAESVVVKLCVLFSDRHCITFGNYT
jgi:hypothetical protein